MVSQADLEMQHVYSFGSRSAKRMVLWEWSGLNLPGESVVWIGFEDAVLCAEFENFCESYKMVCDACQIMEDERNAGRFEFN